MTDLPYPASAVWLGCCRPSCYCVAEWYSVSTTWKCLGKLRCLFPFFSYCFTLQLIFSIANVCVKFKVMLNFPHCHCVSVQPVLIRRGFLNTRTSCHFRSPIVKPHPQQKINISNHLLWFPASIVQDIFSSRKQAWVENKDCFWTQNSSCRSEATSFCQIHKPVSFLWVFVRSNTHSV